MNNNSWQSHMYDDAFAKQTIGSKALAVKAKKEVDFLLKALELPSEAKILDAPCGTGRHSVLFAKMGFNVTGIDISSACISIAKSKAAHERVVYKKADMQQLGAFQGRFDAVVNLFSSFGYFKDDLENEDVLRGLIGCLKPGGKIVIQTINRNYVLPIYKPAIWNTIDNVTTVQASIYDPKTKYNESYISIVNNRKKSGTARYHRMRLYSPTELISLLKKCGCKSVKAWGDSDGSLLNKKLSVHPIYIGTKV